MEQYKNLGRFEGKPSSIATYELGDGCITVVFNDRAVYRYTNDSAGADNIQTMQMLAQEGKGLNRFILKNPRVKNGYVK